MPTETYSFRIEGIAPIRDPQWLHAGPKVRAEFWREVVRLGLELKDKDLAAGKDFEGAKLTPISEYTRKHRRSAMGPAYAYAPPLTPAFELSRTRSLLAGRAHDGYALFFWRAYEGKHWGRILGYHRAGSARLPIRNVIGISDASRAKVERRALKWWDARKASLAPPPSTPPITPKSTPVVAGPVPPAAPAAPAAPPAKATRAIPPVAPPEPVIPRVPITGKEPVEHPGLVTYLPHGTRPSPRSTKITVFSTDVPTGTPGRPPAIPPAIPPRPRPPRVKPPAPPTKPAPSATRPTPPAPVPKVVVPPKPPPMPPQPPSDRQIAAAVLRYTRAAELDPMRAGFAVADVREAIGAKLGAAASGEAFDRALRLLNKRRSIGLLGQDELPYPGRDPRNEAYIAGGLKTFAGDVFTRIETNRHRKLSGLSAKRRNPARER